MITQAGKAPPLALDSRYCVPVTYTRFPLRRRGCADRQRSSASQICGLHHFAPTLFADERLKNALNPTRGGLFVTLARESLLFLCQTLPFPPDGGVNIRTFNILKLLSATYDIHAVCFFRQSVSRGVDRGLEGLRPFVKSLEAFPIEQEHDRLRFVRDHLRSTLAREVYTRHVYENAALRKRLDELLSARDYALVHCDSLDLSAYLPAFGELPVAVTHHNVESALLRRRADVETNPIKKQYLAFQAELMRQEEAYWCPRVALNAVCSPDDERLLQAIAPGARTAVVPNGVDVHTFQPSGRAGTGIVFVGGMTWFPNKDGLEFFADEIVPALQATGPLPEIMWVGRALPGAQESYAQRGITLTGYVDSVQPFVHAAGCFVVPLRVGGGTRLKVLDAWAMGKAVVSTTVGCEGLDARDGENILVRDEPREFAQAVRMVLNDEALQMRLGANARRTAEEVYDWQRIGAGLLREYQSISATVA